METAGPFYSVWGPLSSEMFSLFVLFDVFSGFRTMKGCPDLLPILKDLEVKGQNARDFKR